MRGFPGKREGLKKCGRQDWGGVILPRKKTKGGTSKNRGRTPKKEGEESRQRKKEKNTLLEIPRSKDINSGARVAKKARGNSNLS